MFGFLYMPILATVSLIRRRAWKIVVAIDLFKILAVGFNTHKIGKVSLTSNAIHTV